MTSSTPHTEWCAADHRCNLHEHRSEEIVFELSGYGRAVLIRVQDANGREYAEIRTRAALSFAEPYARRQLRTLLTDLRHVVTRAARAGRPAPRPRRQRTA